METLAILNRLQHLGVSVSVDDDALIMRPGSRVPEDLVVELKEHKLELIDHLRRSTKSCTACLCDDYARGADLCPACHSRACTACRGCLRASWLWRDAERYATHYGVSLFQLLDRLRRGASWLRDQRERFLEDEPNRADDTLFTKMFWTGDDLNIVLRAVHGYQGCALGDGQHCPEDAVIRCAACVS